MGGEHGPTKIHPPLHTRKLVAEVATCYPDTCGETKGLLQALVEMQEDWGRGQNAKALAILEVKDAVIERLELGSSNAEIEVGQYEELAQQAGVRAALATQRTGDSAECEPT